MPVVLVGRYQQRSARQPPVDRIEKRRAMSVNLTIWDA